MDTRGSAAANLSKYDERFDNMAGERAQNMQRRGKEKIGGKNKQPASSRNPRSRARIAAVRFCFLWNRCFICLSFLRLGHKFAFFSI